VRWGRLSALAGGDVGESTWEKESGQGWQRAVRLGWTTGLSWVAGERRRERELWTEERKLGTRE
jgi:hypothetical protein